MISTKVYTPEQVAEMLQLSKNTVYDLISRGEIVAKRIGKVYRIPQSSLSFIFTGLDADLLAAERVDEDSLGKVQSTIREARASLQ
ncbi:helix-turn-helix domain-containing protein [Candidatus Gottesmanbacteria bacterium]|nr:helix-turn-helix domain-containing protein [Candidatus Gottesmanbacteria bacterium]